MGHFSQAKNRALWLKPLSQTSLSQPQGVTIPLSGGLLIFRRPTITLSSTPYRDPARVTVKP